MFALVNLKCCIITCCITHHHATNHNGFFVILTSLNAMDWESHLKVDSFSTIKFADACSEKLGEVLKKNREIQVFFNHSLKKKYMH